MSNGESSKTLRLESERMSDHKLSLSVMFSSFAIRSNIRICFYFNSPLNFAINFDHSFLSF